MTARPRLNRWIVKFNRARKFRLREWVDYLQAWFLLFVTDLGLRTLSYPRLLGLLAGLRRLPRLRKPPPPAAVPAEIDHLWRMVNTAALNHLYAQTCLRRSLTLQHLLARRGILTDLRFGARRTEDGLSAHAWLEYRGAPIGEPEALTERFIPLVSINEREREA